MPVTERRARILLLVVLLLAAGLRLWRLDDNPLWWDEGNNAYFAHQTPAELLRVTRLTHDTDPPAHRLALAVWLRALGDSAYAVRLLSAVLGILTVACIYAVGRWMAEPRVGLVAAALMAHSPMAITYSREAKGYPFVACTAWLGLLLWLRRLQTPSRAAWRWGALYAVLGALTVGAHYYAVFFTLAHGIWLGVCFLTSADRRTLLRGRFYPWIGGQLAAAALVLPWVLLTLDTALDGARNVPLDRDAWNAAGYVRAIAISFAAEPRAPTWTALLAAAALALAAIAALRHFSLARQGLLLSLFLIPIAAGFALQRSIAFFSPRFLFYALPALLLLAAWGMVRMGKRGIVLGGALAIAWIGALPSAFLPYVDPAEDLRPLARPLEALAQPGDGLIVGYIWQEGILRLLAPRAVEDYYLGWYAAATVGEELSALFARQERLWLLTYHAGLQDPANTGGWWLEQHAARAWMKEAGPSRLVLYLPPCATSLDNPPQVLFERDIALAYEPPPATLAAGQTLRIALQWQVSHPVTQPLSVFVHLYDRAGKLWAQHDGVPVNGLRPFMSLSPGETVRDCRAVLLPADLPSGEYRIAVGLYDPVSGARLRVLNGEQAGADAHTVGAVRVTPPAGP